MVRPAAPTQQMVETLATLLEPGDTIINGGKPQTFARLEPIFQALAPGRSGVANTANGKTISAELDYINCGPLGSGHFVKMIHDGIEYALMQAYAEVWRRGTVIGTRRPCMRTSAPARSTHW